MGTCYFFFNYFFVVFSSFSVNIVFKCVLTLLYTGKIYICFLLLSSPFFSFLVLSSPFFSFLLLFILFILFILFPLFSVSNERFSNWDDYLSLTTIGGNIGVLSFAKADISVEEGIKDVSVAVTRTTGKLGFIACVLSLTAPDDVSAILAPKERRKPVPSFSMDNNRHAVSFKFVSGQPILSTTVNYDGLATIANTAAATTTTFASVIGPKEINDMQQSTDQTAINFFSTTSPTGGLKLISSIQNEHREWTVDLYIQATAQRESDACLIGPSTGVSRHVQVNAANVVGLKDATGAWRPRCVKNLFFFFFSFFS